MNWKKRFVSQKLNVKFTLVIILFMVIPIGILAGILFYNMEKNVVSENTGYMEYTMERNKDAVATKINSINMSTQFFLSDEPLLEMLKRTKDGETFSAEEWYSFKNSDIVSLERLVNNNPLLYGVRVYASNDRVQEMMPILYAASRMEKQPWQSEETVTGWHYDFNDQIFNSYTMRQNRKILSLVTEIKDSDSGTLGMIEAAMTMENMFPSLYENIEDEWSCFLTEDGGCYFGEGDGEDENTGRQELLAEIMAQYTADEEIQTCSEAAGTASDRILPSLAGIKRDPALREKYYVQHSSRIPHAQHVCGGHARVFGCSDIFYQCDRKTSVKTAVRDFARNPPRAGRRSGRGDRALRTG